MYKILLVEDQQAIRVAYHRIIEREPNLSICAEVKSGDEALAIDSNIHPDVIILDLSKPGMKGMGLLRLLKQRYPKLPIIVVSGHGELVYAQLALKAGASGFVNKSNVALVLVEAIEQVLDGFHYINSQVL